MRTIDLIKLLAECDPYAPATADGKQIRHVVCSRDVNGNKSVDIVTDK